MVTDKGTVEASTMTTTSPEVVVTQSAAPAVLDTSPKSKSDIDQYFENIRTGNNKSLEDLLADLNTYVSNMKPGLIKNPDDGARQQRTLWLLIRKVASLPSDKFRGSWTLLLNFAYANECFTERYIYRFSENWIWNTDELSAFQRIINLILLTKDFTTRKDGLKQVNLDRSLESIFTQEEKQNIITFYS
jgi:hypothetical protein